MREALTRNEIAAWLQVALGAAGTLLAVLTSIPALKGVAEGPSGLPVGVAGGVVMLQVFGVMLIFCVSVALVATGFGFLLGRLFQKTDAHAPYHAAFCVIIAVILTAAGITIALVGHPLWIWFGLQTLLTIILAGLAQVRQDANRATFWAVALVGSFFVASAAWGLQGFTETAPIAQIPTPTSPPSPT